MQYMKRSMVDVAFEILSERIDPISFKELFFEVLTREGVTHEDGINLISKFYTDLTFDGRFVDLKNNEWDLRSRQTYDKVHIDMNDVYSDIDAEIAENTDIEELDEDEIKEMGVDEDEDEDDGEESDSELN